MSSGVDTSRRKFLKYGVAAIVAAAVVGVGGYAAWQATQKPPTKPTPRTLKISHQWASADLRHVLCEKFAKRVEEETGGTLKFEIYPAQSLYKAAEQYDALVAGALDLSVYPLDYASGKVPQLSITLMPCSITNIDHGMKWKDAEIGKKLQEICEKNGIKLLVWYGAWFGGGIGSVPRPIILPEDVKGLKMRAAGRMFETMLNACGAAITSMPSSELYQALQTKVLDACLTSSESFYSYRLYEVLNYYTSPRKGYCIWFMLEPLVMGMPTWNSLTPEQQKAVLKVSGELESWLAQELKASDIKTANFFEEKGLKVHDMTMDEWNAWAKVAENTSWKTFSETVPGGKELIELMLKVKP
ncbi:MAG: TRAP transporter substrate-binding protein DctP [Candidatus Bathyarchaeota archaeon]